MNERPMPPLSADERTMLEGWLEFYRATLVGKCADLPDERLREASAPPSPMTLLGLVQHAAEVERHWFRRVLTHEELPQLYAQSGNGNSGGFETSDTGSFAEARATWEAEVAVARENCAAHALEDTRPFEYGGEVSLRWIYQHMIAEYARHCGHADLIRERIDGVTGV